MQNINRATEKDSDLENVPTSPIQGKLTSFHHQHVTPPFNLSNDELSFPLFSSQVEIGLSFINSIFMQICSSFKMNNGLIKINLEPSYVQQRRISGSGKSSDPSRHVTAYTGVRRLN